MKKCIALKFRHLKIDKTIIIDTIKSTASTIEDNFSIYDVKKKVTCNIESISLFHLDIEGFRKIDVTIKEDLKEARFVVYNNCNQNKVSLPLFITLSTYNGIYEIEYVNSTKQKQLFYDIDGILRDLIMINN